MTTILRTFLALSLLATTRGPADWEQAFIRQELTGLLVAGEVMDARELPYIFAKPHEMADDTRMIRLRLESLAGAPPIDSHMAFVGDRQAINDALILNRSYQAWCASCLELNYFQSYYIAASNEAKQLYEAWDLLRDAKTTYYYAHIRRQALNKLQKLLGVEAFERGLMPPIVPTWHMTRVR